MKGKKERKYATPVCRRKCRLFRPELMERPTMKRVGRDASQCSRASRDGSLLLRLKECQKPIVGRSWAVDTILMRTLVGLLDSPFLRIPRAELHEFRSFRPRLRFAIQPFSRRCIVSRSGVAEEAGFEMRAI